MIKRRSFLTYFSLGCLAGYFPVALAACAPKSTEKVNAEVDAPGADDKGGVKKPAPLAKTADGYSILGTVADLDKTGRLQGTQVAVSKDPTDPKKLVALNLKCTHNGCPVSWIVAEGKYECPCHGANFAADGKVLKGPATQNLATYPAKIVGKQVLVKI